MTVRESRCLQSPATVNQFRDPKDPMPAKAVSAGQRLVAGCAVVVALLCGCSSNITDSAPRTIASGTPAVAPTPTNAPAGVVRQLAGVAYAAIVDPAGAGLVVLTGETDRDADTVTVMGTAAQTGRTIALPQPATAIAGDGRGSAVLSTRGGYFSVDLMAGTVARVAVDGASDVDFTAIARRADGRLVLGSSDGTVFIVAEDADGSSAVEHRDKTFARVDSIVTQGNTSVVLDRGQTSVTALNARGNIAQALRAGEGATTMVADPAGRVLVTDPRGQELLVFSVDPLIMRQRYPVSGAPYGLAGSQRLAWVSQTASNTVIGYELATGIPVEKVRYPTVQQPNILAYDDASDVLYVVSGSGAGVQVIEQAAGRA